MTLKVKSSTLSTGERRRRSREGKLTNAQRRLLQDAQQAHDVVEVSLVILAPKQSEQQREREFQALATQAVRARCAARSEGKRLTVPHARWPPKRPST